VDRTDKPARRRQHVFGGDWTAKKLEVVAKYLGAYTRALKNQPFEKVYIDAFAGTGYRSLAREAESGGEQALFPDFDDEASEALLDGSAAQALRTIPPFDRYIFVEQHGRRCEQLEILRSDFPQLADRIEIQRAEANQALVALSHEDWRHRRAVVFLDPYGMQVEWTTIEQLAATQAIDLWILVPIGIGASRLLKRSGAIPPEWQRRLDRFLGTSTWFDELYAVVPQQSLFGDEKDQLVRPTVEAIGQYFNKRLGTVFPTVAEYPGALFNSRNCPLYLLCFAASNPRGAKIAVRIANSLLRDLR